MRIKVPNQLRERIEHAFEILRLSSKYSTEFVWDNKLYTLYKKWGSFSPYWRLYGDDINTNFNEKPSVYHVAREILNTIEK